MRPGAQIRAAAEVLEEVLARHQPAAVALAGWGKSHRFAGSGDRAAIGNLVYDALRRRRSFAAQMDTDTPRALALAAAPRALGLSADAVISGADGSPYALAPLSEAEQAALARALPADAPAGVRGDIPDWLEASFVRAFGDAAGEEGAALARRAPLDLRVNTLKADREKVLKALAKFAAVATPLSPAGVRLPAPEGARRQPSVEAEAGHGKGWYEVQDEGSQIAALMAATSPRQQVLDICAGAGGKTLAMAAAMRNTGQIYAYDDDAARLRPIFERLKRAGVRNAQVLPAGDTPHWGRGSTRCSSTRPAPGPGPGAGGPTPSGGSGPRASSSAWPSSGPRWRRRRASPDPAADSSTSPARCCRRRTVTRLAGSRRTILPL
jgi:16S rRNA (cytosine967-C5)-methyltransferase